MDERTKLIDWAARNHETKWASLQWLYDAAVAAERERRTQLATDLKEYLYRTASQVPFEHAAWAQERGAALLAALRA